MKRATATIIYADLFRRTLIVGFELRTERLTAAERASPVDMTALVSATETRRPLDVAESLMIMTDSSTLSGLAGRCSPLWVVEIDDSSGQRPLVVAVEGATQAGEFVRVEFSPASRTMVDHPRYATSDSAMA